MTLAIHDRQETALAQTGPIGNPIAAMLQTIIQGNITSDTAATMEKLTELYLKVEADNARKAFAAAKIQLQSEMPRVFASRVIPDNNGKTRSVFAAYEDIMEVVQPMLVKHGFSVSFTSRIDDSGKAERMCVLCKLSHCDGHSETNEFAVRVSKPPGASEAQGDGSTHSYAKRYALCDALNITIDKDNDARVEGDYITPDEARELEDRVIRCKSDVGKFLKFAMAESFATIRAERLKFLHDLLDQKERQQPSASVGETTDSGATSGEFNATAVAETLKSFNAFYVKSAIAKGINEVDAHQKFTGLKLAKSWKGLTDQPVRENIAKAIHYGAWNFETNTVKE